LEWKKTPGPALVSTNQTGNPRCKALPVNKAPKAQKNPFNKKTGKSEKENHPPKHQSVAGESN
jgi:hypothetical protein